MTRRSKLLVQGSATITESTAGTYRYISGVPYYNTGSPASYYHRLNSNKSLLDRLIETQARLYSLQQEHLLKVRQEQSFNTQTKTYAQIDGASSFLDSGIPIAQLVWLVIILWVTITASVNGSARAVGYIDAQMFNVNGSSSVVDITNKYIQIYSASLTGLDEEKHTSCRCTRKCV